MQQVTIDGVEYQCPEIQYFSTEDKKTAFRIIEGDYAGKVFGVENMKISDTDDTLLVYDLLTEAPEDVDLLKKIVDNFLVIVLYNQAVNDGKIQI